MSQQYPLTKFGQLALQNLQAARPQMYGRLRRSGKLLPWAYSAQEQAKRGMDQLAESGRTWDEAFEIVNSQFLDPPSEKDQPKWGGPVNQPPPSTVNRPSSPRVQTTASPTLM